jgi:hypothetical protein
MVRKLATAGLRAPVSEDEADHTTAQLVFGGTLAKIATNLQRATNEPDPRAGDPDPCLPHRRFRIR